LVSGNWFGPPACTVPELLADPAIDIVLNLTTPAAHVPVALQAVAARKHVYGEKPLAISTAEARVLLEAARAAGVRLGCAPDTFLGGGHQSARRLLDDGAIGRPIGGTAFLMLPGHKHAPIEIYGTEGSLAVPDPNRFGGEVELLAPGGAWQALPLTHGYAEDNYRILGLADMADAIAEGRPHRASGELAFHVLEVMEAFQVSSDAGRRVTIASRPERPAPLPADPDREGWA
jgi:predicted dehydrogenase